MAGGPETFNPPPRQGGWKPATQMAGAQIAGGTGMPPHLQNRGQQQNLPPPEPVAMHKELAFPDARIEAPQARAGPPRNPPMSQAPTAPAAPTSVEETKQYLP